MTPINTTAVHALLGCLHPKALPYQLFGLYNTLEHIIMPEKDWENFSKEWREILAVTKISKRYPNANSHILSFYCKMDVADKDLSPEF